MSGQRQWEGLMLATVCEVMVNYRKHPPMARAFCDPGLTPVCHAGAAGSATSRAGHIPDPDVYLPYLIDAIDTARNRAKRVLIAPVSLW